MYGRNLAEFPGEDLGTSSAARCTSSALAMPLGREAVHGYARCLADPSVLHDLSLMESMVAKDQTSMP